ncbi:MAG: hypothetical protein AAFU85_26495 [Planctomycetota bacterium]
MGRFVGFARCARASLFSVLLGLLLLAGCSKEDLEKAANSAKQAASDVAAKGLAEGEKIVAKSKEVTDTLVEKAEEVLPAAGKIKLATEPTPIETDRGIIVMYSVGDGRKNSMQITSYEPKAASIDSTAVFIHATTDIETVALLGGKTIPCNVFVESAGVVSRNVFGKPVEITFGMINVEENTISATMPACMLLGSNNKPLSLAGGEIVAVITEQES